MGDIRSIRMRNAMNTWAWTPGTVGALRLSERRSTGRTTIIIPSYGHKNSIFKMKNKFQEH